MSAYMCCACSPTSHSISFMALALFGACLASTTPDRFTCVPPPWKVGRITLVAVGPGLALGFLVVHQRPVIGVADADVALAGRDVARGLAVAAGGLLRQIGLEALQPFLGLRLAVLGEIGGEQRVVVHVLAGADADLALPLRVGQFLVGDRVLLHALLRGVDDARAHRDAVPVAVRVAVLRRAPPCRARPT